MNLPAGTGCIGGVAFQGMPPICNGNSSTCPSQPVFIWNDDADSTACYTCGIPNGNSSKCKSVKSIGKFRVCLRITLLNSSLLVYLSFFFFFV